MLSALQGVLGEDQPAARSHFLQAYRVLKLPNQTIVGIVMEKANGQNVSKTLNDPNFCNVSANMDSAWHENIASYHYHFELLF